MFELTLTGFPYLIFVSLFIFLYYMVGKKRQWYVLLGASIVFFLAVSGSASVVWILLCAVVTYFGALKIEKTENEKLKKAIVTVVILLVVGELALLKYIRLDGVSFVAPIAISFYSLSILSYVLDVYWGISKAEKNPFMHLLYLCYFPQMTSGPITRYRDLRPQFVAGADFDYKKVKNGLIRIVYGMMKKCVIADQVAVMVNTIFGDTVQYQGAYVLVGAVFFALQLYTDFSGCMDIILGTSECFQIKLPENFEIPFSSTTMSEFWRRWHITLGVWFKEYVMYPLLKSAPFQKLTAKSTAKFGKKKGKKVPTYLGLFIVWFLIGYWHGGALHYIIGSGLLHWFYIVSGELLEPHIKKLTEKMKIDRRAGWYVFLQRMKVFCLVCSGFIFFRSPTTYQALKMIYRMILPFEGSFFRQIAITELGLSTLNIVLMLIGCVILWTVSYLKLKSKEDNEGVRELLSKQSMLLRYAFYLFLMTIVSIAIIRNYGADVSYFIYNQF